MADVDHPKTHVEDQNLEAPRKQPESPQHEGIDPLTESDTMYPAENTKNKSEALARKEEREAAEATDDTADTTVTDQEARNARVNSTETDKETGTQNTSPSNKTAATKKS